MSAIKDVLSRKLFSQGGLLEPQQGRNIGGIIASSEPLMNAARFANGGANFQLGAAPSSLDAAARSKPDRFNVYDSLAAAGKNIYQGIKGITNFDPFLPGPDEPSRADADARGVEDIVDYYGGVDKIPSGLKGSQQSLKNYLMQPGEEFLLNRMYLPEERPATSEDISLDYSEKNRAALAAEAVAKREKDVQDAASRTVPTDSLFSNTDSIKDAVGDFFSRSNRSSDAKLDDAVSGASSKLYEAEAEDIVLDEDKTAEGNLEEKQSLESFLDKVKSGDLKEVDIDALKKRIGEAFDPLEKNPTTEGLLLAELGASIMNKGFKKGVLEGLPKITAYHDSQFKAKQKRKDDVTALAVGEFLKDKGIEREIERDKQKELSKTNSYLFLGNNDDWTSAGYDKINASSSPKYLSARQAKALSEAGVNVVAMKDFSADIISYFRPGQTLADPKYYDNKSTTPFLPEFGISTPINYLVGNIPEVDNNIIGKEKLVLGKAYVQAANDVQGLKNIVDDIARFKQKDLTGYKSVLTKTATAVSGLTGSKDITDYLNRQLKAVDAGKIGSTAAVDITKRLLAAQIAPMILGESGKTISDPDRQRVANIIGLGAEDLVGLRKMGADAIFNAFLITPGALEKTLEVLNASLQRRSKAINDTMESELTRFGIGWKDTGLTDPSAPKADFKTSSVKKSTTQGTTVQYDAKR